MEGADIVRRLFDAVEAFGGNVAGGLLQARGSGNASAAGTRRGGRMSGQSNRRTYSRTALSPPLRTASSMARTSVSTV